MGGSEKAPQVDLEDLWSTGKMKVDYVNGNKQLPMLYVDESVKDKMCSRWKDALVVSLLGKKLGYRLMKTKLCALWKLSADFELLDVDNGFFLVKFDLAEDRKKVMEGGPWMIFDHYLAVTIWTREFIAPTATVSTTLVWIRIPGLNATYYDASFLMSAAKLIGKPVRVDMNTLNAERGKFARICVELDLTKPVLGKFWFEGNWFKVVYEGLHIICGGCGCYGHHTRDCSRLAQASSPSMQVTQNLAEQEQGGAPPSVSQTLGATHQVPPGLATAEIQEGISQTVISGENNREAINKAIIIEDPKILDAAGDWLTVKYKKKKNQSNVSNKFGDGAHKGFKPPVGNFNMGKIEGAGNSKKRRKNEDVSTKKAGRGQGGSYSSSSGMVPPAGKPALKTSRCAPSTTATAAGASGSGMASPSVAVAIGTPEFMKELSRIEGSSYHGGLFQGKPPDKC
ncbi:uncharacterized protein LOC130734026 [Lotus japonicus]|uniref:uncharacterized protein LOC130734026 n=1 Tax=Lotus japonicus TaxID=34305 RepID=UPI0025837938|nr:uncharacterized protein LOC130734026 [Lotus japonicus]